MHSVKISNPKLRYHTERHLLMLDGGPLSCPLLPSEGVRMQTPTHLTPGSAQALGPTLHGAAAQKGLPESHRATRSHLLPWLGKFFTESEMRTILSQ